jgi:hypothetical protein
MTEAYDSRLYQPRTPRQHQFFLQLETACDLDDWISRSPLWGGGSQRLIARLRDFAGQEHRLEVTPQFRRGIRKIIFARLMDLTAEGHGPEALYTVVGWRARPPDDLSGQG